MDRVTEHSRSRTASIVRLAALCLACAFYGSAFADPFFFTTGSPNGLMASASRPSSMGGFEIESADDFILGQTTRIDSVTFTGLLPSNFPLASIGRVRVEIYRVFPKDSADPPSGRVPTRVNSPSDIAFDERDSTVAGDLNFTAAVVAGSFTVQNSVTPGGIHPIPGQTTGGNGPQTGEEVLFQVNLLDPFILPADHYFFVPQVQLLGGGDFLWLSAPKPIVVPGMAFMPDLQSWTRDQFLDPDWLRIGTDIVGGANAPTFNAAFSLVGQTIPEPTTLALLAMGVLVIGWRLRRAR